MSESSLIAFFFLQVACILLVCRAVGLAARYIGQPQVVAEMLAGFLIGPSFFGWIAPGVQQALFPADSLRPLYVCSQFGLALYMFTVGLEFRMSMLAENARRAASLSVAGLVAPFTLGVGLAIAMLHAGGFFNAGVTATQAVLTVGAAMSITAFPMLARIIYEQGIAGTALGTLALTAGALDDAAAWAMLALVIGSLSGNNLHALWPVAGGAAYALIVLVLAQPLLQRLSNAAETRGTLEPWMLSMTLTALAAGAWFTDMVGIHSVFGAFVLGVAIPRGVLTDRLQSTIEPLTTAVLLPLFFVYAGLNTKVGLVNTGWLWVVTLLIFLAACAGKGLACWAAARLSGASSSEAMGIGALMNARGLMELVLLNITLQRGVITETTYTILVMMTLATTLMAYPLFGLIWRRARMRVIDRAALTEVSS
jgi:Kef-type K+ transport system membrane component KefB